VSERMWMVRSGGGKYYEEFKSKSAVTLGWDEVGKIDPAQAVKEIAKGLERNGRTVGAGLYAGIAQIHRFATVVKKGDRVVTYNPSLREYLVGTIASDWQYDLTVIDSDYANIRKVMWDGSVSRDVLSVRAKNSLGSTLTLFLVPPEVAAEIETALRGKPTKPVEADEAEPVDDAALKQNTEEQALEFTKDRLNKLDWSEMQDVVAGILRAMGYKTRISPSGPDQGKDIVASPDGLGFEQPRIVVEVKHRSSTMGSKEIRSFLGGRHKDDRGLYVSTGGFTKDAYYEAERAGIPLTLMDLDDLVKALVENYESLDAETKRLIPLKRIYWPA
jgi:restriction system protein